MSELLIRPNASDVPLLRRVLGPEALANGSAPDRLVVDAHVAARRPEVRHLAERSGTGLLIDPQTHFLQDHQPATDPWTDLPYARADQLDQSDFAPAFVEELVRAAVQAQVDLGATQIIAPYVHIGHRRQDWRLVQARLWSATRRVLDDNHITLPVLGLLSLDWRAQDGLFADNPGSDLGRALRDLAPTEVAVAASAVTKTRDPEGRIESMLSLVSYLARLAPVLAWQQGLLGELCVAAGAAGYETGIGTRETYDVSPSLAARRRYGHTSPRQARPVYIRPLQRSIPKASVTALAENPRLWPFILCHDEQCCEPDGRTMLSDARQHAVVARKRALQALEAIPDPQWRWRYLATRTGEGAALAARINRIAATDPRVTNVPPAPLVAAQAITERRAARRARTTA
ncbi:hypothetical protein [Georgenia yuyongxinii]